MPSIRVHRLGKATATRQNSRRIPNPRLICQRKPDATNVEHNTNQQLANKRCSMQFVQKERTYFQIVSQQNQKRTKSTDENSPTPKNDWTRCWGNSWALIILCQGQNTSVLILVTLKVNGIDLEMELDTGATLSVISEQTYHKLFFAGKALPLKTITTQLTTYTGEAIEILGEVEVTVQYKG